MPASASNEPVIQAYGVPDDMYTKCGHALLVTLEQVVGEAWSPALASAWGEAFEAIASLMQEGARNAPRPGQKVAPLHA